MAQAVAAQPQAEDGQGKDLKTMRHSAAHVMAEAVQQLFPEAKFGIGPAIDAWRESNITGGSVPRPAPMQDCPPNFGNSDIFGGTYPDPTP